MQKHVNSLMLHTFALGFQLAWLIVSAMIGSLPLMVATGIFSIIALTNAKNTYATIKNIYEGTSHGA